LTWVKICGTTNLEDAQVAAEAGADALGFIFAPSPRRISPRDAKKIIAELPHAIEKIGVFVNQKPEIILETANTAGLTGVQFHGDETLDDLKELRRASKGSLRFYGAVRVSALGDLDQLLYWQPVLSAILVDSGTEKRRGGTGRKFDWEEAAPLVRLLRRKMNVVIAGGLDPKNVRDAIARLRPWGVDVVSGVEKEPGKKDHEKVRAFVKAAKAAAQP
jgi:phosphoribosylanthranilate isomerase